MERDLGKLIALVVGVGVCLVALSFWGLSTSGSPPGLDLRLIAVPPGELTVEPTGVMTSMTAMQAGERPARGGFEIRNIAGRELRVRIAALPSARGLGRTLRLRAVAGERAIASGALGALRRPGRPGIRLDPRESRRIELSAWLPAGASGYRGRIVDVSVELSARPLERVR